MKIFLGAFFFVALFFAAVIHTPAAFLYENFFVGYLEGKPIKVSVPEGNAWHGRVSLSSTKELPLVQVSIANMEWYWKPEALKNGAIGYEIRVNQVNISGINFGDFIVNASITENVSMSVKDYASPIKLNANVLLNSEGTLLEGSIKTKQPNPQIDALLQLGSNFIKPQGNFKVHFK